MVAKMIKHELFGIFRIAVIPIIVMLLLAVLCRVFVLATEYYPASYMYAAMCVLILFYSFAIAATICVCVVLGIVRFYKPLFTGEGYMTLSLPVTADQIIWAKLISAVVTVLFGALACAVSSCVFLIGAKDDVFTIIYEIFSVFALFAAEWDSALFVFEFIFLAVISVPVVFLEFYFVMSIGQLCTVKNRWLVAVALYIGIGFAWGMLSAFAFTPLLTFLTEITVHLYVWISIVFKIAEGAACYFVVRYILKNKVNLLD